MLKGYNFNFGTTENNFQEAKVVIFPVPYEVTVCYGTGTKKAPDAIISASKYITEFDIELQKNLDEIGFFTLKEFEPSKNSPKEAIEEIENQVEKIINEAKDKFFLMLGGEHSITLGAVKAFLKKYPRLSVLQLDAHADLYDKFQETSFSHACTAKRIHEMNLPVVGVGIRGLSNEEWKFIKEKDIKSIFYAPEIPVEKILGLLNDDVYLTVDMDVFDPSIMPAVGTPEPGGLGWYEVLNLIREVAKKKNIVGADVVEFSPIPGFIASDYLAAKLVYKIIGYKFCL